MSRAGADVRRIRVAFFGTPEYAVPTLRSLDASARYNVVVAVTQPDRPAGRGRRSTASPVKIAADELGLPVYQPETLRTAASRELLAGFEADVFVVAAYGLIFGPKTLAIPKHGCMNLHASLLPKYRGPSPIAAAILAGDSQTGVTLMLMDVGIDTGAILDRATTDMRPTDTTATLSERLGRLGADLAAERIADFVDGTLRPARQPEHGISLTRMLTKADGRIDWRDSGRSVERLVRATWPWPRAWTTLNSGMLQIHAAHVIEGRPGKEPGQVSSSANQVLVACGSGFLALDLVQTAGGRPISGTAWLAGLQGTLPVLGESGLVSERPPLVVEI